MVKAGCILLIGWLLIALGVDGVDHALWPAEFNAAQILTAHWVHLDLMHACVNGLGWLLAVAVLRRQPLRLLWLVLIASVTVSAGWLLSEETAGYAGLSGVLYMLASYVVVDWLASSGRRWLGVGALVMLAAGLAGAGGSGGYAVAVPT